MTDQQTTPTRPTVLTALRRRLSGDTDGGGRYRCTACDKMVPLSHQCPKASRSGFLDRYGKTGRPTRLSHSVGALRPDLLKMASPCTGCGGHGYILVKRRNEHGQTVEVMERCSRCGGSGTDPSL